MSQLQYFDLSNNQLTGLFPEWVHSLRHLAFLNLGQNDITGNIPLVIGEGRPNGGSLTNIREFVRLLRTPGVSIPHRNRFGTLRLDSFMRFLKKYYFYIKTSIDLLWIDLDSPDFDAIILQDIIDKYIQNQEKYMLTKAFQNMLMNPLLLIDNLHSTSSRQSLMDIHHVRE